MFLQSSGVFYVFSGTVRPNIYTRFPDQNDLLPIGTFDLKYGIDDTSSWINTSSESLVIQKWDGISSWGTDIAATYQTWESITTNQALYNIVWLPYGKYRSIFSISDNNGNTTTVITIFYVDAPSLNISAPEYDIGDILLWSNNFWAWELVVTVETVWAAFELDMLKTNLLSKQVWVSINDWNGTEWFWYDQESYSGNIQAISTSENIASQTGGINTDWEKNTYTYRLKYGALILSEETIAWEYDVDLDFHIDLQYADVDNRCILNGVRKFTCDL